MSYFGPLENFNVLETPISADCGRSSINELDSEGEGESSADQEPPQYPSPHDAPRSPSMDSLCWEVKWEHRDDCVSALMVTLSFELFYLMNDIYLNFRLLNVSLT